MPVGGTIGRARGMLVVETIARIRREHFGRGKGIKAIARELRVSRKVVRKVIRSGATAFTYERREQPHPKLGRFLGRLEAMLAEDAARPRRERLTLKLSLGLDPRAAVRSPAAGGLRGRLSPSAGAASVGGAWSSRHRCLRHRPLSGSVGRKRGRGACTPTAGWEKGHAQVGFARDNIFRPRERFRTLAERGGWLEAKCRRWAETQRHPELRERTVALALEAERPALVPVGAPFDGGREVEAVASSTCLVSFEVQPLQRHRISRTPAGPGPRLGQSDRDLRRCGGR